MLLNPLKIHTPTTLQEAVTLYKSLENVKIHAGGTFLLSSLKLSKRKGSKTPENVISLSKINDLKGITADREKLVIKAMTTIDDLQHSSFLEDNFSVLKTVCKNISTQPIRNMATVGGNLTCRYTWTEMPAVMVGLNAALHFLGKDGQEEIQAAEDFYKNQAKTDKILSHIVINRDPSAVIAYQRVKKSQFVDIPLLSLIIKTMIVKNKWTNTRVAVNNCVQFAQRDKMLEDFLNNKSLQKEIAKEALDHIDNTIYDTRSSDYKKYMFRVCIHDALQEIIKRGSP